MKRRHVNEFIKTKFANSGRIAGMGIDEDSYDDKYIYHDRRPQPKFDHSSPVEHGEVVVRKASEVYKQEDE